MNSAVTPKVLVEPANRCALLQIYRDSFAILPFRHSDNMNLMADEEEGAM
jgi:hypothetical protein